MMAHKIFARMLLCNDFIKTNTTYLIDLNISK
jgi:hypothetical protein